VFIVSVPMRIWLFLRTAELSLVVRKEMSTSRSMENGWRPAACYLPTGDNGRNGWTFKAPPPWIITCHAQRNDDDNCTWLLCYAMSGNEIARLRQPHDESEYGKWILDALEHKTGSRNYDLMDCHGGRISASGSEKRVAAPLPLPDLTFLNFMIEWCERQLGYFVALTTIVMAIDIASALCTSTARGYGLVCWTLLPVLLILHDVLQSGHQPTLQTTAAFLCGFLFDYSRGHCNSLCCLLRCCFVVAICGLGRCKQFTSGHQHHQIFRRATTEGLGTLPFRWLCGC